MFKHNIYGDQPEVPDGMPDSSDPRPLKFFVNLRCLLAPTTIEAIASEAEQSKMAKKVKDLERSAPAEDFAGTS